MQLKSSIGFKPLLLSVAAMVPGGAVYAYENIDSFSKVYNVSNAGMCRYLEDVANDVANPVKDELKFNALVAEWENETIFLSSLNAIVGNANFKAIVGMGERAVPYILNYIAQKPSTLVWALNEIYRGKISNNPKLTIPEACKLWLRAFRHEN